MARGPAVSAYWIDPVRRARSPRYTQSSVGLEQRLPGSLLARVDFLRKRGRDGFSYASIVPGDDWPAPPELVAAFGPRTFDAIYLLDNERRDVFDSAAVSVRRPFANQYEFMASYTRSRALSNAVVDVNIDDPLIVWRNAGPMPWDAPHRFLSWGYLPSPFQDWALAYLFELRNGYPFSVQDDGGRILEVNTYRYPVYFELNLHTERKFTLRGHGWAFRVGVNNLTGRRNPNTVNANTASPNFGRFYGGQGRAANFRIRWLGRQRT